MSEFGKIGVDQACSGINGLQSSLVVTLSGVIMALAGLIVSF